MFFYNLFRQTSEKLFWTRQQIVAFPLRVLLISLSILGILWLLVETYWAQNLGFNTKSLWDWMELLLVPASLAFGLWWLNESRRRAESKIAKDKQYQLTLESYLDRMASLLLDRNLRNANKEDEVRIVAQTLTIVTLQNLDGVRKGTLIKFLYEAGLIKRNGLISLHKADLRQLVINNYVLSSIDFSGAFLQGARFNSTDLSGADFRGAQLGTCEFREAKLDRANFAGAFLVNADVSSASLHETVLFYTFVVGSDFSNCDFTHTDFKLVTLDQTEIEKTLAVVALETKQKFDLEYVDWLQKVDIKLLLIPLESAKSLKNAIMPGETTVP